MATATATRTASRLDLVSEGVGSRFAEFAAPKARALGKHLVHVAIFLAVVYCRDHTTLQLAAATERAFGSTGAGGVISTMIHAWAAGFDGIWSAIFAMLGSAR